MRPAAELLLVEADALAVVLDRATPAQFDLPTVCDLWSVRDVLAHCSAALGHLVDDTLGSFSPEDNQRDVDARADWTVEAVRAELTEHYRAAAAIIDAAGGLADGLGLGEWVHGGDVREPLGEPDAYASAGVELALGLISARSIERGAPGIDVEVDGVSLEFGDGSPLGQLITDAATFVRLVAGRRPDPDRYDLTAGLSPRDLLLFS